MSGPPAGTPGERADALRARLEALARAVDEEANRQRARIDAALPKHRESALNLAHYIGLRKQEVRRIQLELAAIGLSSLGRCESHVRDTLARLCAWLAPRRNGGTAAAAAPLDRAGAGKILRANTRALFGPRPDDRHVYIMVTAPDAEQVTAAWVDEVLEAGANLLRINAAHETAREWSAIVATARARARAAGRPLRVFVDLPGPKLRTEIRQFADAVLHLPRNKDRLGRTVAPTPLRLVAEYVEGAEIPVPPAWVPQLQEDDAVEITDAGGRERAIRVLGAAAGGVAAECDRSLYVTSGLALRWRRGDKTLGEGRVGTLPPQTEALLVEAGDTLLVNADGLCRNPKQRVLAFPEPQLLEQVKVGERVVLDDGRLVAVVEALQAGGLLLRVQRTAKSTLRLRSGKGIAFPDSRLSLRQLGPQDEAALAFALQEADGVGVSFVNSAKDVALVGKRLKQAARPGFGMILKIETRGAMRNLGAILFEALKHDPVGLMIARGDLAVETGFEKLAEVQEELLWFGEACHLPVIWATQVLDSAAHTGIATRAEITDAAMSMRAECVMLNKGAHIGEAVRMLADIIRKMEAHQYKKRSLYRPLAVAWDEA